MTFVSVIILMILYLGDFLKNPSFFNKSMDGFNLVTNILWFEETNPRKEWSDQCSAYKINSLQNQTGQLFFTLIFKLHNMCQWLKG